MGSSSVSLGAGSRVERFLSSPTNIEAQKAIKHNISTKRDLSFLDRLEAIKNLKLDDPKLDPITVENTLKTFLDKDLLSNANRALFQQDSKLLEKILLLANSSDKAFSSQTPEIQSLSGQIINLLITDKETQEYLLNSDTTQKNLLNFTKLITAASPEQRLHSLADFFEGLSTQKLSLNEALDSFFANLEKGQAGELGKQIKILYEEGKIANELKSFLAVPEQYLGDSESVQSVIQSNATNKSIYERLSAITQEIMNKELAGLSNANFKSACIDLLSHDKSIRERGKQQFAEEFHSKFEEAARLAVDTKKIESVYSSLKEAVQSGDVNKITLDSLSEARLLSLINSDQLLSKMLSDHPLIDSQLTEKHLPLLRVALERANLKIDSIEEKLTDDLAQIAKANLSLKVPCGNALGAGIGSLMLTRLLEEDSNGENVFSKYRVPVPDDAIHLESGTLAALVRRLTDRSLNNAPEEFDSLKNKILDINVSESSGNHSSFNLQKELNAYVSLISSSPELVNNFETLALESQSARTFLEKHTALNANIINLNDQLAQLYSKSEYRAYLNPLINSGRINMDAVNSEQTLLEITTHIQGSYQNKAVPEDLKKFLDLVDDRLKIKKDMGLMFLQTIQEERDFQANNGISSPYNRIVSILNQNFRDYEATYRVSLPSDDLLIDLFTRIESRGIDNLVKERREHVDNFHNVYHDFKQTTELLRNPDLNKLNSYAENRDLVTDEYARFTHIFDRILIRTDDVLSNQQNELINTELKKMNELNPEKQANYSLSRIVTSILQLLSKSFQELIGDLNLIDQTKQGAIVSYA